MTGGIVCSVATCKSNSKKAKQEGQFLRFFRFPKDPKVRKEWIKKCNRQDKWDATTKRICSKHFKPEDYEDKVKAELMNVQPKVLKKNAVPALFLLCNDEKSPLEKSQKMSRRKRKSALNQSTSHKDKDTFSWQKSTFIPCDTDEAMVSDPQCDQRDDVYLYDSTPKEVEDTQIKHIEETSSGVLEELKCNLCEQTITGPFRYSCVQCHDFDLCGACEARGAHQMHYVLRAPEHKNISEVQSLIRVIRQALTADITAPVPHYFDELKMEIKEEEVERPEPYPDDDDPLSWSVKLDTKDGSSESDTSDNEEQPPPKRRLLSPKTKTKPIIIPRTYTKYKSILIQNVAASKNNLPTPLNRPSEIKTQTKTKTLCTHAPEILETSMATSAETAENTLMCQPITSHLHLKEKPLLQRQIQTADRLNIQTFTIKTQRSPNSSQINISDKTFQ